MATSVHTPSNDPNSNPRLKAPMGLMDSNTGMLVMAESTNTPAATATFVQRGSGISETSILSFPRSQSTASPSRFTGHTQPQNARPRTSAKPTRMGRHHTMVPTTVFAAAMTWAVANGSSRSMPTICDEDKLPQTATSAGM